MSDTATTHRLHGFTDLLLIVAVVAGFDALVALTGGGGTPLRVALGLPVLLFVPGYALVAALYPHAPEPVDRQRPRGASTAAHGRSAGTISTVGRFGLSVLASVAAVAATGLAVNASPWSLRPLPWLAAITVVTLVGVLVALYRRTALPRHLRYHLAVPWRSAGRAVRPRFSGAFVLGLVFVASVVAGAAVLGGYVGPGAADTGGPTDGLAVLTADGDGDYVAANYTDAVAADRPLHFRVANHGDSTAEYTVVPVRETVAGSPNETTVAEATERERLSVSVAPGDSAVVEFDPRPVDAERPERLRAYLYRGDAPSSPSPESALRTVQIWYVDEPNDALDGGP